MTDTEFKTADQIEEVNPDYLQLQLMQMEQMKQQSKAKLYQKLQQARKDFSDAGITKTGENHYQNYKYIKLDDILDLAIDILLKNKLSTHALFGKKPYGMELVDLETGYSEIFESEVDDWIYDEPGKDSTHNKILQTVGKKESYIRRYLYMQILDIHDSDTVEIDAERQAMKKSKSLNPNRYTKQEKPKMRNIQDLAGQLADEMASKGIEYNVENMWQFINDKWQKQLINNDELKALRDRLGLTKQ